MLAISNLAPKIENNTTKIYNIKQTKMCRQWWREYICYLFSQAIKLFSAVVCFKPFAHVKSDGQLDFSWIRPAKHDTIQSRQWSLYIATYGITRYVTWLIISFQINDMSFHGVIYDMIVYTIYDILYDMIYDVMIQCVRNGTIWYGLICHIKCSHITPLTNSHPSI